MEPLRLILLFLFWILIITLGVLSVFKRKPFFMLSCTVLDLNLYLCWFKKCVSSSMRISFLKLLSLVLSMHGKNVLCFNYEFYFWASEIGNLYESEK